MVPSSDAPGALGVPVGDAGVDAGASVAGFAAGASL